MSQFLEHKYILLFSGRLPNFKRKSNTTFNFRCIYCADSQKSRNKARGYIYLKKGSYKYHCHNCGAHPRISELLKDHDPTMYKDYLKEILAEKYNRTPIKETDWTSKPSFAKKGLLDALPKVSSLPEYSIANMYLESRDMPESAYSSLYLSDKFKTWVNTIIPDKFDSVEMDEPRLVIPFIDFEGRVFGFQGRSFDKDTKLRYISIMLDEDMPKIFGLERLNKKKQMKVVEGPLDSYFLSNCIASAGSDLITNLAYISKNKDDFVVIFDNEPRNVDIVKKMQKAIEQGYPVCIWPDSIKQKDINLMVLNGYSSERLEEIINENTKSGLYAKMALQSWKRV